METLANERILTWLTPPFMSWRNAAYLTGRKKIVKIKIEKNHHCWFGVCIKTKRNQTAEKKALTPGPSLLLGGLQPSQQLHWQDYRSEPAASCWKQNIQEGLINIILGPTLQSKVGCPALPQFSQTISGVMFFASGHSHVLWLVAAQFWHLGFKNFDQETFLTGVV